MAAHKKGAYLTVYASLVFGIVLSLIMALIEGATIGTARVQSEMVADLGLDSVFAEYNRELLEQYDMFFIDDSYCTANGGVGKIESHLSSYVNSNADPSIDCNYPGHSNFLRLSNPYLEIESVSFATDNKGEVWKAQAVDYMKATCGLALLDKLKNELKTVNDENMTTRDIFGEISSNINDFDDIVDEQEEIVETDKKTGDGFSYEDIIDVLDTIKGKGILHLVTDTSKLSGGTTNRKEYVKYRQENGNVNKGAGLHDGVDSPDGFDDELFYNEYILKKFGFYNSEKDIGPLKYEVEYILYGRESDISNLRESASKLLQVRMVSNFIYLNKDKVKKAEAEVVALAIASLLLIPEAEKVLQEIILGIWAYAESVVDVRCLFDGGKVPLMKQSKDWTLGLSGILNGVFKSTSKDTTKTTGLSYKDYLRIFLALSNKDDRLLRSLDVVEMDIRQTKGNENFRIDQCVDYMKVNFGFQDKRGHEFVFTRIKCYE